MSHDLAQLLDMLSDSGGDVTRFDGLVDHTPYAVRLRNAGAAPDAGPLNRPHAIEQVETLRAGFAGGGMRRKLTKIDVSLKVPTLEMLVSYTASGIGAIPGPMLAPWKVRKEAAANLITARSKADSLKENAEARR